MSVCKAGLILGAMAMMTLSAAQNAQAGQCRDPWVTQAIQQVTGRAPNASNESGECNIRNFNKGSWGSYPELLGYVQRYFNPGRVGPVAVGKQPSLNNNNSALQIANSARNGSANGIVAAGGGNAMDRRNSLIGDGGGT